MILTNPELLYSLETSLHRPDVRLSSALVANLLTDEFIEFGRSGRIYNKQFMIEALQGESSSPAGPLPQVEDFSVSTLSNSVVLVTYKSIRASVDKQKSHETLRSSIWKMEAGQWQMIFHQGTPVPDE
ncbi:DUF4440 domain-containing protein [Pararhizobium sp. BT-229]|uniref:nuclear transport factor 2 family protein n=1 Tax=Pararhizobium sp. BT-229 TaxID=2986923 RepID=UPI0021F78A5C|nr:DUF4440 domain-containing protein [Pararhizobium sp. BT-229]MCV9967495.1 DUF4440 domain-containing protein [Pararhizobium sp. BT-229]